MPVFATHPDFVSTYTRDSDDLGKKAGKVEFLSWPFVGPLEVCTNFELNLLHSALKSA